LSVVLLLSECRAIINGLDVILHSIMLQIIYSTVYRVKRLIEEEQTTQWTNKRTNNDKGNNKITEVRTIFQRESQNS
jgi:hypothetical protein